MLIRFFRYNAVLLVLDHLLIQIQCYTTSCWSDIFGITFHADQRTLFNIGMLIRFFFYKISCLSGFCVIYHHAGPVLLVKHLLLIRVQCHMKSRLILYDILWIRFFWYKGPCLSGSSVIKLLWIPFLQKWILMILILCYITSCWSDSPFILWIHQYSWEHYFR